MEPFVAGLLPFLALGLVGALHCAGMCGGFAAIVAGGGRRRGGPTRDLLAYVLGKALTYAVLGALAAAAGHLLAHGGATLAGAPPGERAEWLLGVRRACAWLAGVTLVLFGAGALGLRPPSRLATVLAGVRPLRAARALFAAVRTLPGLARPLGIGLVTGLLPCGLSWSAFALAASAGPLLGPAGAFAFGLATGPVLLVSGWGWSGLFASRRTLALRLVGPLLIAFGAYTALRGGLPFDGGAAQAALPPCCAEAGS